MPAGAGQNPRAWRSGRDRGTAPAGGHGWAADTVFVGLGEWGHLHQTALTVPGLPPYDGTHVLDTVVGVLAGVRGLGAHIDGLRARVSMPVLRLGGGLAVGIRRRRGQSPRAWRRLRRGPGNMTGMGGVDGRVDTQAHDAARRAGNWPYNAGEALVYGLGLLAPVVVAAWALDRRAWWLAAIAGVVAVVVYGRAAAHYRDWAISSEGGAQGLRLGVCAVVGVAACTSGAALLERASDDDSRFVAAFGIALVVVGLMPIMHAIRYEPKRPTRRPWTAIAFGWILNTLFAFAALTPGLLILGAPVLVALFLPAAWLASVAVNRLSRFPWYVRGAVPFAGLVGVVSGALFWSESDPGNDVTLVIVLLLVFLGCIDAISAPVRRQEPVAWSTNRETVAGAAVAGALLVTLLLRVTVLDNVPAAFAVGVVLACFVFGGSYIRRGQGFVVLALLGALTLWVIADRDDHAPIDPAPEGRTTIVALGDSYASGEGGEAFFDGTSVQRGNDCRRSSNAYGYQVARKLDSHLEFFACSGALATHVWKTPQIGAGAAAIGSRPQLDNPVTGEPDLVLISIGGNDALFGAVGRGCALPGSCVDIQDIFDGNLTHVREVVTEALGKVAERYSGSPILVVPYPQMLPIPRSEGGTRTPGDCDGVPLGGKELDYLHGFVAALDEQVARAVAIAARNPDGRGRQIAYFAAGEQAYLGHRVCGPGNGNAAVNTLAFAPTEATDLFDRLVPTSWTHNSFHPKRIGHDLLTEALVPWIRSNVPGFGPASEFPATLRADPEPAPELPRRCVTRKECTDEVKAWSTGKTVEAIQRVFPFAFLIGLAGWLLAAVRRLPLAVPE